MRRRKCFKCFFGCMGVCLFVSRVVSSFVLHSSKSNGAGGNSIITSTLRHQPLEDRQCYLATQKHGSSSLSLLPPLPANDLSLTPDKSTTTPSDGDDFFRTFRQRVPKRFQSWMRDSGTVRAIMDGLVWTAVPNLIRSYPWVASDFLRLTAVLGNKISWRKQAKSSRGQEFGLRDDLELTVDRHFYANDDKRQFLLTISSSSTSTTNSQVVPPQSKNRTIVIVHGGAWGSGFPEMYALAATPFLNAGYSNVAIVGYRTFPSADLAGQIDDVSQALTFLATQQMKCSSPKMTVIGHSSGAHVLTIAFLQGRLQTLVEDVILDQFLGMAGIYDIPSHYRFERSRGVERISPMAAACGYTLSNWKRSSPIYLWDDPNKQTQNLRCRFPGSTLFLHGGNDTTVPHQSSEAFAHASGLQWRLLEQVGHADLILELMFGGTTRDAVLSWIEKQEKDREESGQSLSIVDGKQARTTVK